MLLNSRAGLRAAIDRYDKLTVVLVEVISYYKGMYGRFLILVSLGIGLVDSLGSQNEYRDPFLSFSDWVRTSP